ncbi:MAG TPA: ROK family protein [Polyangiaceae bacterium]|jgi:polyphosphate glucokinase
MSLLPPRHGTYAGPLLALEHRLAHVTAQRARAVRATARTLVIDVGGTGIKMIVLDSAGRPINERARLLTPHPASPEAVLSVIASMLPDQPAFDRVSCGFPGVIMRGVVRTAVNLGPDLWRGVDFERRLAELTQRPVRAINDANLQGYGVISGHGVELAITLGTGVGAGLFTDGHLVPNLELGHHPWKKGETYEDRLADRVLKEIGKKDWSRRVFEMIEELEPIFNYDTLYLGGGNAEHIRGELPKNVQLFTNVAGMMGGIKLWELG